MELKDKTYNLSFTEGDLRTVIFLIDSFLKSEAREYYNMGENKSFFKDFKRFLDMMKDLFRIMGDDKGYINIARYYRGFLSKEGK